MVADAQPYAPMPAFRRAKHHSSRANGIEFSIPTLARIGIEAAVQKSKLRWMHAPATIYYSIVSHNRLINDRKFTQKATSYLALLTTPLE